MTPDQSSEKLPRQLKLLQFIFPNEYPFELVRSEMEQVLALRFVDPQIESDLKEGENMGTFWNVDISFISRRPTRDIEEMDIDELELELLAIRRLPDEF